MKTNNFPALLRPTGRCGDVTYYVRKGNIVARLRHNDAYHCNSLKSSAGCTTMSNTVRLWNRFPRAWKPSFMNKRDSQTDYNSFVSHARYGQAVYLDSLESQQGVTVLVSVAVSDGTLPTVELQVTDNTVLTDIVLNEMTFDTDTTVSALTAAVLENNPLYRAGDALLLYSACQRVAAGMPQVTILASFLPLDRGDDRRLTALLGSGVTLLNAGGRLATPFGDGRGVAWVHLRPAANGAGWLRSTQWMEVRNTLAERYMTVEARDRAVGSYKKLRSAMSNEDPDNIPNN